MNGYARVSHIDLIGAYRPNMREVDDTALLRARVFVDSFDTTIGHIGEINIPLEAGTITRDHLVADYYAPEAFHGLTQMKSRCSKTAAAPIWT